MDLLAYHSISYHLKHGSGLQRAPARNPVRARERHARHRRGLDAERHQILALEMVHALLAAGARDHRQLHAQRLQVVAHTLRADGRFEALLENWILRRDSDRTAARVA